MTPESPTSLSKAPAALPAVLSGSAFGCEREFLGNRYVYVVVSSRARGLSIGVNMNPDKLCNFNCVYCEVDRAAAAALKTLDVDVMADELQHTLGLARSGKLHHLEHHLNTPSELLVIRHVALSGDGEPTLCPNFLDAVQAVMHARALRKFPFFKIVLITNASGLDLPDVQNGLKLFTDSDEIWAKLDAGTQDFMEKVNRTECPLEKILANILAVAQKRPVIIQSLFSRWNGDEPPAWEIEQYAQRLRELKESGAQIPLVQIYSATRPALQTDCGHLPLKALSQIAERVREVSGLRAEVF